VAFFRGFARGLAFVGDYALVGLSKLRSTSFGGLPLEQRLADAGQTSQCGLLVIDITTGAIVHSLLIDGAVEELFDVAVLPDVQRPQALGFQNDEIERLISFPGSGGLVTTKPTVKRPGLGTPVHTAGLPRISHFENANKSAVKFQQVYHLTPDNLASYEAMTYPSLRARWQTQALRGELFGVSASVDGDMVGFAIAEQFVRDDATPASELLSLFVVPAYRHQGIATALVNHLQRLLATPLIVSPAGSTDSG
jgi:GNAT superfamily N-acetyltransferase